MSGTVLYRKWRPTDFDEVVGQETVVRTLQNAVAQDKIAHAYLFCGPRGTGKTTTARILARAINGRTASGDASALGAADDLGFDLVEIDAASNRGIDDIRELRERANYQPGSARFRVYLIDEVHQLTGAAADALLKTLEEPPPHVVFILATTDPEALKPTILSRCQRFDFRRVGVEDMVGRLRAIAESEEIEIPDEALRLIAREATGSLRDGINLLDQVWVMCGSSVTLEAAQEALGLSPDARAMELASAALRGELSEGLAVLAAVQEDAIDFGRFKRQVVLHLRHALLNLTGATGTLALSAPEMERLQEVCEGVEAPAAVKALRAFTEADVRRDPYQPLPLELALAAIVYPPAPPPAAPPMPAQRQQSRQPQQSQRGGDAQRRRGQDGQQQAARKLPNVSQGSQAVAETSARPAPPPASTPQARPPQASGRDEGPSEADELLAQIMAELRNISRGGVASALNRACKVVEQTEDTLTLGFPSTRQGNMNKAEESVDAISAAASKVLQRQVTVRCVAIDASTPAPSSETPPSETPPSTQPPSNSAPSSTPSTSGPSVLAQEARERFGAQPYQSN